MHRNSLEKAQSRISYYSLRLSGHRVIAVVVAVVVVVGGGKTFINLRRKTTLLEGVTPHSEIIVGDEPPCSLCNALPQVIEQSLFLFS